MEEPGPCFQTIRCLEEKLEKLSHREILKTFRNPALLQGQCRCIFVVQKVPPYSQWHMSKPHLDFSRVC